MSADPPAFPAALSLQLPVVSLLPKVLLKAIRLFEQVITNSASLVLREEAGVPWHCSALPGSQVIAFMPAGARHDDPRSVQLGAMLHGELGPLIEGRTSRTRLPEEVLRSVAALARLRVAVRDQQPIVLWGASQRLELSPASAKALNALLAQSHVAQGTVEGKLETLSNHGKPHVFLYDPLRGRRIECLLTEEQLEQARLELFGKRVEAIGEITYGFDGQPQSIAVAHWEALPTPEELGDFRQFIGLLKGYEPLEEQDEEFPK